MDNKVIFTTPAELAALIKNSVTTAIVEHESKFPRSDVEKAFLTIDDACKFLNLAKQTLYTYTSKSEIPFIKRGKKLYFKKEDLKNWLLNNKKG